MQRSTITLFQTASLVAFLVPAVASVPVWASDEPVRLAQATAGEATSSMPAEASATASDTTTVLPKPKPTDPQANEPPAQATAPNPIAGAMSAAPADNAAADEKAAPAAQGVPATDTAAEKPDAPVTDTAAEKSDVPATDTAAEKPDAPATDTAAATPAPAKIDLEQLEDRLRNTDAIGFFTKLSLKNEVDDLLTEFGAYHKNKGPELASLKDRFDLLLLKVLTLLQDNDKKLSEDIVASRDQIFGLLSDPKQFAKL